MSSSSTELLYFYKDTLYVLIIYVYYKGKSRMCQQKSPVLGSGPSEQAKSSGRSPPVAPLPAGQATTGSADASFFHSLRSLQNGFAAFRILNAKLQGLVSKEFQQLNILCFI